MIDKDNVFEDDITSTNLLQVADVSDDTFDYAKLLKKS